MSQGKMIPLDVTIDTITGEEIETVWVNEDLTPDKINIQLNEIFGESKWLGYH